MGSFRWVGALVAACCGGALAFGCSSSPSKAGSAATSSSTAATGGGATSSSATGGGGGAGGGGPFMPASHPPFPDLPANDGVELKSLRLVVIVGPTEPDAAKLFSFGDSLLQSAWLGAVGKDYGIAVKPGATSMHLTGAAVPATMDHAELRTYVNAVITANPDAAPDGNTVYLFFYPPGTTIGDNCADLGAHGTLSTAPYTGAPTDALAWVQRCQGPTGLSEIDALTMTASHEVLEAATDAYPPHGFAMPYKEWALAATGTPWSISSWSYLQGNAVENGDLCQSTTAREGGFAYQRIWSTTAAAKGGDPCAPALSEPYYSASAPSDWIEVPAGTTASVPLTGWSTAPRSDWSVIVRSADFWDGGFGWSFADGTEDTTLNNGKTAMLSVTTPPASGAFAALVVKSSDSPPDPTTGFVPQPAMGDREHVWVFGVRTTDPGTPAAGCGDGTCDGKSGENCASCPDDCGPCGAVCGAANFGVPCGSAFCPTNSTCQPDGSCACDSGYASTNCDGTSCSGASCAYPSWWCAPSTCGMSGFVTQCTSGSCPAGAVCLSGNRCACAPGTLPATCEGGVCPNGGCSFPDWGCAACGSPNANVQCNGYTCPAFSTCGATGGCTCLAGYRDVTCDGKACSSSNPCTGGNWWCYPE